jgi:ABC-type phosphate/phosphonate transport system substrate-binding protein
VCTKPFFILGLQWNQLNANHNRVNFFRTSFYQRFHRVPASHLSLLTAVISYRIDVSTLVVRSSLWEILETLARRATETYNEAVNTTKRFAHFLRSTRENLLYVCVGDTRYSPSEYRDVFLSMCVFLSRGKVFPGVAARASSYASIMHDALLPSEGNSATNSQFPPFRQAPHKATATAPIDFMRSDPPPVYNRHGFDYATAAERRHLEEKMNTNFSRALRAAPFAILLSILAANADVWAQKAPTKTSGQQLRVLLAINEGGAANADASETFLRYEEFSRIVGKALGSPVTLVAVRDRNVLKDALKRQAYLLLFARPNDVPAEAIRDFGYQAVTVAREPSRTLFIVKKDSPLNAITDVRGKSIVTPDQYSNMWRVANAMLRDAKITMANEKVRAMRDQAAIGWAMENGFFDVGVINSVSGVGKSWEKNGGRVIARSPDLPNMPLIASPAVSPGQIAKIREALLALDSSDAGQVVLKKIGLTGFKEATEREFLDFLKWIGDLEEVGKQQ